MSTDFASILAGHLAHYPRMEAQDCVKLAYQSEFGPAHLFTDDSAVLRALSGEWQAVPDAVSPTAPEDIGSGLCRFPLTPGAYSEESARLLTRLFLLTAQVRTGTMEGLEARLTLLEDRLIPGMGEYLTAYRREGCPAVHHSETYRAAYHPHYRLLRREYAHYFPLLLHVQALLTARQPLLLAIDGMCGSGKTGLAALLASLFPSRVIHTDDFYLPAARRADNWQSIPAGNMDLDRLREEVLIPARTGRTLSFRPFLCSVQQPGGETALSPAPLTIVEGSYALHPSLESLYHAKIFLTCSESVQNSRLQAREGDYFSAFCTLWIPLEKQYHRLCGIPADALTLDTTQFFQ